ncbi:MAG: RDD family protein [Lautropia sp.]
MTPRDADPWRRSMAAVYEGVILFGVVFFFGYAFSALTTFKGAEGVLRSVFQAYLFVVLGAYFTWFWSDGRRTLPMKTMAVTLVTGRGNAPVSKLRAAWRYAIASLLFWGIVGAVWKASIWWLLLWPLPFLWSVADPQRRTLYDVLAGTRLVTTPH